MLVKSFVAGVAGSALLATVAFAQTPTDTKSDKTNASPPPASTTTTTTTSTTSVSFKGDWRASKVVGLSVYNDKNESVGSINDLLMEKSGAIKAVVVGVGGFLGVGEHLVALPLDKVKFVNEPVASTTTSSNTSSTSKTTTTGAAPAAATSKPNPWYPDHAVISASKDELKAMPEFKYSTD
ncbi:PRC-barrel domain-containing protein [Bradyrhizobium tropiciagri]|uniref:PRC-barrel domain-containing protein n=1 Tax=Bradyrhizobium tropiciagri TaxID=312253 RepID=UPI001BA4FF59|nr:PRC-barrel domain-containing protein [Bradyrhizobium tropiciagri]MBR0869189.1 PRC-barrel domain-containing protein [Bradyrhizobium tropiciagri]